MATSGGAALSASSRIHRMRARSWVLRILYVWETQEDRRSLAEVMEETLLVRRVASERKPHIRRHIATLEQRMSDIDQVLGSAMDNWKLGRLSRIDRSVLRLAAAEMLYLEDVPDKVSLQEAIRLAGQYGGDESPGFVNGVLDAVFRTHRRQR